MRKFLYVSLCVLCLLLSACATSKIVVSLNISALAVSAASTTIAGVQSMDSGIRTQVVTYLSAISTALTSAAAELKTGSITAVKVTAISAALSAAVVPVLPDSVPGSVKTSVTAVTTAVQLFLSLLSTQSELVGASNSPVEIRLSYKDRRMVNNSLNLLKEANAELYKVR